MSWKWKNQVFDWKKQPEKIWAVSEKQIESSWDGYFLY